ncbi:unnamed protein product [Ceutorhynchus assimilis]|uniref:GPI alpha-1,4-mannosyltransferase I, catalytic subunit n=1 Tax=Ceutorhynchus assimilis TaxID=467358 RepID=A0A9P0GQF8_9CUCU|nr:unnamed protein product [Ceutorhynchus assimilis]
MYFKIIIKNFLEADMVTHIIISSIIRLLLIAYGVFHDNNYEVPYTDVDYKVFTDAARHVVNGNSPYERHTFRYSPLIAILLTPNIFFNQLFGKIIFCEVDLIVAYFIRRLVYVNIIDWMTKYESFMSKRAPLVNCIEPKTNKKNSKRKLPKCNAKVVTAIYWAHRAMLVWLYNPMTIAISTRGNSDSISCFLVILTLYCIQTNWKPFVVGLLHGFAIHFRIYPIIYSLLYYMHYSSFAYYFDNGSSGIKPSKKSHKNKQIIIANKSKELFGFKFLWYLWPNYNQIMLVLGTLSTLLSLTVFFYYLYGYKFLYESLIYHFVRVDFRHNFSLYFYLQYLVAFIKLSVWYTGNLWQPILINLPPIVLLLNFSIRYGLNKFSLNFAVLIQTIVFVIYNKVITSQYFVWIMGILPLCIWQIKLSKIAIISMVVIWFLAQAAWLLPAYLLEFKGEDTFFHIWIQGVSLFCAHIGILGRLIKNFIMPKGVLRSFENRAPSDKFYE